MGFGFAKTMKSRNMKAFIKTKPFLANLFFLFFGVLCMTIENIFFGHIDPRGILQESFFLPLSIFSFLVSAIGLIISLIWFYFIKRLPKESA